MQVLQLNLHLTEKVRSDSVQKKKKHLGLEDIATLVNQGVYDEVGFHHYLKYSQNLKVALWTKGVMSGGGRRCVEKLA